MPSKKKKYNARFPAGRIKKIMQSDEEIGKVAQAVPVIISRTLELFVESLLNKTLKITNSRNAKTLSTSHMKQCIMSEQRFDFLRELVKNIPDISVAEEMNNIEDEDEPYPDSDTPYDLSMASTSIQASVVNIPCDRFLPEKTTVKNLKTVEISDINTDRQTFTRQFDYMQNMRQAKNIEPISISKINAYSPELETLPLFRESANINTVTSCQNMTSPVITNAKCSKFQTGNLENHQVICVQNIKNEDKNARSKTVNTTTNVSPKLSPILNHKYQFNDKSVVKIDYTNISIPSKKILSDKPQSIAETNTDPVEATEFNFTTQPVINIDLSNIVSPTKCTDAVATISLGNISTKISNTSSMLNDSNAFHTLSTKHTKQQKSFFELDEDYDNI